MATLKFNCFNLMNNALLKTVQQLPELAICLFRITVRIFKKILVPTKRAIIILINTKSRNALLPVLPVCIRGYIKSVLRY